MNCCETAKHFGLACRDHDAPRGAIRVNGQIPDTFFDIFGPDRVEPIPQGEKPAKPAKVKNLCLKTRPKEEPYEIWKSRDGWTWNVLKKWQADDNKPYARWFCFVTSPFCPEGEYGDTYVKDIVNNATKAI